MENDLGRCVRERTAEMAKANDGLQAEIGERTRVEEEQQESEAQYRSLFENSIDGVLLTTSDGRILAANREACHIFGRTEAELCQVGRGGVVDATDSRLAVLLEARSRTGKCRGELTLLRRDGTTFEGEISSAVFMDRDGAPRTSMIIRDITERKEAEEVLRTRTRHLEAIRAVTTEITHELNPTRLLALIIERATDLVGASVGRVWLWDEEAHVLVLKASQGPIDWMGGVQLQLGKGVAGTIAGARKGLIVNDYTESPYAQPLFRERGGFTAVMGEPLLYRDRLLGVLMVSDRGTERLFSNRDQETLRLFATQAAIAIENARLHSEVVRRADELESLLQANQTIMSGLDLHGILDRIAAEAIQIAGTSHVRVMLLDQDAQVLRVVAQRGQSLGHPTMPLESLSGRTAQTSQPVFGEDLRDDPSNPFLEEDRTLGIVTHLSLPIKSRDAILGVLTFNTTSARHYSTHELAYLASFADQAAIAIENARLFQSVSEQHTQLRAVTARLADAGEMERQRLSRELHDCVGGNLTALNFNLSILQGQLQAQGTASATGRIEESMRLVEETVQHIRSVMTELRPPLLDDQGLLASLRWYVDQFSARTSVTSAVRGEDPRPRLPRSAEIAIFRIAQEVLTNVAKHAAAREVTLILEDTAEQVRLTIADDGVGFDPATVRPSGEPQWWGLITMRERAVAIGGSLRVESILGSGTRVIVEVPR